MKFDYVVLTQESIDLDFDEIHDFIKPLVNSPTELYETFVDDPVYYIDEIEKVHIDIEANEYFFDRLIDKWESYMEDRYGSEIFDV